jgi:hypothetical protein
MKSGVSTFFALMAVMPGLSRASEVAASFVTLYAFNGDVSGDGISPRTPLAIGSGPSGHLVLYGTTYMGGAQATPCYLGCGTVFSLTPPPAPGDSWTETQIHLFMSGKDGFEPTSLVIGQGPSGHAVLYGTTAGGGQGGTAYSLTPPVSPGGSWTKATDELSLNTALPSSLVFIGGALYGTSGDGESLDTDCFDGCGGFFSLVPPEAGGGSWTESILYSFRYHRYGGYHPIMAVMGSGPSGHPVFYGTSGGGYQQCPLGCGVVFSLTPPAAPGGAWTETVLHRFTDFNNDGCCGAGIAIGNGPSGQPGSTARPAPAEATGWEQCSR